MGSLIETFHIDAKLIIAQMINFAIIFSVLYWFAFKPLAKMMSMRSEKIEKSLVDAREIEEKLAQTKIEFDKTISEAKKQAGLILEKAAAEADVKKQETVVRAKEEIGAIINQEKQKMQMEKALTLKEIRKEAADLIIATVEKVLSEKVDEKKDRELIKRIMR